MSKKAKKEETRAARIEDLKAGAKLYAHGSEWIVQRKYDKGIWEARDFQGSRIVGEKCIFEGEIQHYQVKL